MAFTKKTEKQLKKDCFYGTKTVLEELQHLDDEKIEIESLIESESEDSHDSEDEEAFMNGEDLILDRYVEMSILLCYDRLLSFSVCTLNYSKEKICSLTHLENKWDGLLITQANPVAN